MPRKPLFVLAVLRLAVAVIAIPLVPVLFRDHFLLLVFMRPTKELFLAGGFLVRQGDLNLLLLILASIPLSIFGAWLFYLLGRSYEKEIDEGKVPDMVARILKPERVRKFEKILDVKGPKLIFLGRIAVMSSAGVAAGAGAARMAPRKFFPVDFAGGMFSIAYTITAGYFLGEAYERAGPWITGLGVIAFMAFAYILGRALTSDFDDEESSED